MGNQATRRVLLVGCLAALIAPATASAVWTGPVGVSEPGVSAYDSQVAVDADDNVTAVWSAATATNLRIRSAFRPAGGPWETSFTRIPPAQDCGEPQLAVNPAGAAVVVADCGTGTDSMYAAYRPAGGSWAGSVPIPGSGSGSKPSVGLDDAGNVIVVWGTTSNTVQSAYRPAAGPWTAGGQASPAGDVAVDPDVAMSPTGGAVAVWRHRLERSASDDVVTIESTKRVGTGAWGALTVLTRPAATSAIPISLDPPQISLNREAQRMAVWVDDPFPFTTPNNFESGWGGGGDFGTWGGYFTTGTSLDPARNAEVPQVALSEDGASVAVWRGFDPMAGTFRTQAAATTFLNGNWSAPTTLADVETGLAEPQVAIDPEGNATVMWRNLSSTMSAVSRPVDGAFGAAVTLSTTAFGTPDLTMNATGDTVAIWTENTSRAVVDVDDVTPPDVSAINVPAAAISGSAINVSAAASDTWSTPVTLTWDFGDGTTATGASASHTYATPGTRMVSLTAVDAVGNSTAQTRAVEVTSTGGTGALDLAVTIRKQSWKKIRKAGGIKVKCSIDAVGRCDVNATIARKIAKRIGVKGSALGAGSKAVEAAGETVTFVVKLKRKARAAIGRADRSVPLTLGVTGTAAGRDSAELTRKFKIKR